MIPVTEKLADFAAGLTADGIPPRVARRAKLLVMDLVGIALRARHDADSTPPLLRAVSSLGLGSGSAGVIGDPEGYAPPAAALLNGALGHSLDFDDTHAAGSLHAGAPVVPAVLAAAQVCGASGRDVLAAIVGGLEITTRLSMALGPADHYDLGFHPTATCGTFAATAAAGRTFGLTPSEIENAFGICLSQAAGSLQFLENGAHTKRFQVGNAAMNGLIAASLSREGLRGAARAIEGRYGFLHAYAPNADPEKAAAGLGREWETMRIGVKPYPACRYTHAVLDAAIALSKEHGIGPTRIRAVEVGLPRKGVDVTGEPQERKRRPMSVVDGQFSMHFVLAVILREGRLIWDDYTAHLSDPETFALMERISVGSDARAEAEYPRNMSGSVKITMDDGAAHEAFVAVPRGEPDNFMTDEELREKFSSLVGPYLPGEAEEALYGTIMGLETSSVTDLFRWACPPPAMAQALHEA